MKKVIITIVVKGENVMGQPLAQMNGVLLIGRKCQQISYNGPVTSCEEVVQAIQSLFTE